MLLALLCALALAPIYWLAVPAAWRREALTIASLVGLAFYDWRLVPFLLVTSASLSLLLLALSRTAGPRRSGLLTLGLALLFGLFASNKLLGGEAMLEALPSQPGLVLLGVSFLAIKAAGALIEVARGTLRDFTFLQVLGWLVFLPTYPSGPMEELDHFRSQKPTWELGQTLAGLERILFGLVKTLVLSHGLGEWLQPVLAAPAEASRGMLLLGLYAITLRFYFDFSGYSDIAIGLASVFGIEVAENFDHPLTRRNLVQFWQRWHITLTRWLRSYLFVPISRRLLRRAGRGGDRPAVIIAQIVAMTFCGLWHGLTFHFALWGFLHAVGLLWVGLICRDIGRVMPAGLVEWWRTARIAYALSTACTFHAFALTSILLVNDVESAATYLGLMLFR